MITLVLVNQALTATAIFWRFTRSPKKDNLVTHQKIAITAISQWSNKSRSHESDNVTNKSVTIESSGDSPQSNGYNGAIKWWLPANHNSTNKSVTTSQLVTLHKALVIVEPWNDGHLRVVLWRIKRSQQIIWWFSTKQWLLRSHQMMVTLES